jgi:adenosylmethionine-8-amino-7-oxononanoate aminotransferase
VLDIAARTSASGQPARVADRLDAGLRELCVQAGSALVASGRGCFRGLTVHDHRGHPVGPAATLALVDAVREAGAIAHPGPAGLQLVPALVYTDEEVDELLHAVSTGLDRLWDVTEPVPATAP